MDKITLGDIKEILLWLVVFGGAIGTITGTMYALYTKALKKFTAPIKDQFAEDIKKITNEIVKLKQELTKAQLDEKMERLKSDLTTFMYLAEYGTLSNEQKIRAHEEYDEYISMKGNSWVHDRFESLVKEGKL